MNVETAYRVERDPLGEVKVPAAAYYGVQTARAIENFPISGLHAPPELVTATVAIKKAAAQANASLGRLDREIAAAIVAAADEILAGRLRDQFVVDVYQAGAGTSHNMNTNEVLANRAAEILDGTRGTYTTVHPNDHVNMGQSTNDVFPAATRVALLLDAGPLVSTAIALADSLARKGDEFADVLKTGRTHLQDAVPMTLGQEFSGYAACVRAGADGVAAACLQLHELNLGATAVGTGLNAKPQFGKLFAGRVAKITKLPFTSAPNKFEALASNDAYVFVHGALDSAAAGLFKIANDIRLLGSGPRSGLGELILPENEPGSSIMPGKVNPTQSEALTMVCTRVFGNQTTIAVAGSQGHFELNVYKPVLAYTMLQSIRLIADAARSFTDNCVVGIRANEERIRELTERSLMLVTALAPKIGYDKAARIAKTAHAKGTTLREEAVGGGYVTEAEFDRLVRPEKMIRPG